MKSFWIIFGVVIILIIGYFVYMNIRIKKEELEAKKRAQVMQISLPPKQPAQIWTIVGTILPFVI